jgi:purine-binding chemotaxis protein CheW
VVAAPGPGLAVPEASGGGFLTVVAGGATVSLPAGCVQEVFRPRAMTRVPHAPAALLGLTSVRGSALPVVSLSVLMGRDAAAPSDASRVVVVEGEEPVGLLVEAVSAFGAGSGTPVDPHRLLAQAFAGATPRHAAARGAVRAEAGEAAQAPAAQLAVLAFVLAGQDFALPLEKVVAVMRLPAEVAAVPRTGEAMLGVTTRGGQLLPLVSPHALLGLRAAGRDARRARIVVIRLGSVPVGLVVDEVTAILRLAEAAIDPVPPVLTRGAGEARVEAIGRVDGGKRLVSILSPARLFDDETATRLLAEAGREAGTMTAEEGAAETVERFVVFRLGEEQYGLPIGAVDEIARRPASLTRVPRAPDFVAGVMNLRGAAIPVIDQRRRFATGGDVEPGRSRVIVITIGGLRTALAVDAVTGILALSASELTPAPGLATGEPAIFDRVARAGGDGGMILLIEPKALLDAAERDLLGAIARDAAGAASPAP